MFSQMSPYAMGVQFVALLVFVLVFVDANASRTGAITVDKSINKVTLSILVNNAYVNMHCVLSSTATQFEWPAAGMVTDLVEFISGQTTSCGELLTSVGSESYRLVRVSGNLQSFSQPLTQVFATSRAVMFTLTSLTVVCKTPIFDATNDVCTNFTISNPPTGVRVFGFVSFSQDIFRSTGWIATRNHVTLSVIRSADLQLMSGKRCYFAASTNSVFTVPHGTIDWLSYIVSITADCVSLNMPASMTTISGHNMLYSDNGQSLVQDSGCSEASFALMDTSVICDPVPSDNTGPCTNFVCSTATSRVCSTQARCVTSECEYPRSDWKDANACDSYCCATALSSQGVCDSPQLESEFCAINQMNPLLWDSSCSCIRSSQDMTTSTCVYDDQTCQKNAAGVSQCATFDWRQVCLDSLINMLQYVHLLVLCLFDSFTSITMMKCVAFSHLCVLTFVLAIAFVSVDAITTTTKLKLSVFISASEVATLTLSTGVRISAQVVAPSGGSVFSGCQSSNGVMSCASLSSFYGSALSTISRGNFIQDFAFSVYGIGSQSGPGAQQLWGAITGNVQCQDAYAGELCDSCYPGYVRASASNLTCVRTYTSAPITCVVPSAVATNYKVLVDVLNVMSFSTFAGVSALPIYYLSTVLTNEPSCVRSLAVLLDSTLTCPTAASRWMIECHPDCVAAGVCHPCGLNVKTSTSMMLSDATCKTLAAGGQSNCDGYFFGSDCTLCPWFVDNSDGTCTRALGITYNVPTMATQASVACKTAYSACTAADFTCADDTGLSAAGWCLTCVSKSRSVSPSQHTCSLVDTGFNCAGQAITADCPCSTNVQGNMCTQCLRQYSGYPTCTTLQPNFNPDGTCKQDSTGGYWSADSNCTLCITGYYGNECKSLDPWYENTQSVLAPTCSYLNRGNTLVPTDCSVCTTPGTTKVTGTYPNNRAYVCQIVTGFNASSYPLTCVGGKDVKTDCTICPRGYSGTNCATLDTAKFFLPAVSVAVQDTLRAALKDTPAVTPQCQVTRTNDYCTGCNTDWVLNYGDCTDEERRIYRPSCD